MPLFISILFQPQCFGFCNNYFFLFAGRHRQVRDFDRSYTHRSAFDREQFRRQGRSRSPYRGDSRRGYSDAPPSRDYSRRYERDRYERRARSPPTVRRVPYSPPPPRDPPVERERERKYYDEPRETVARRSAGFIFAFFPL